MCDYTSTAILIAFEAYDIYNDFETWDEYKEGRLMPRDAIDTHAQRALLAFAIIGLLVSMVKIALLFWNFRLLWSSGHNAKYGETYRDLNFGVTCAQIIEVLPQSIIGWAVLRRCPKKHGYPRWVEGAFSYTCLLQYVFIFIIFANYAYENFRETMYKKKKLLAFILGLFLVLGIVGVVFAILQVADFHKWKCL